jgi:hypothetical protein
VGAHVAGVNHAGWISFLGISPVERRLVFLSIFAGTETFRARFGRYTIKSREEPSR